MPTIAEQLREEGLREVIYTTLSARFDRVPMEIINSIQSVSQAKALKNLQRTVVTVSSLDEFRRLLNPIE